MIGSSFWFSAIVALDSSLSIAYIANKTWVRLVCRQRGKKLQMKWTVRERGVDPNPSLGVLSMSSTSALRVCSCQLGPRRARPLCPPSTACHHEFQEEVRYQPSTLVSYDDAEDMIQQVGSADPCPLLKSPPSTTMSAQTARHTHRPHALCATRVPRRHRRVDAASYGCRWRARDAARLVALGLLVGGERGRLRCVAKSMRGRFGRLTSFAFEMPFM